jgi:origin recognition complex subunit 1
MQALYHNSQRHSRIFYDHIIEMPHKATPLTPRQKRAQQNEKARKLLAGANLRGDDSDDEEEYEWIYEEDGDEFANEEEDGGASKKRKRQSAANKQERTIVGAKKGSFNCMIGDSVLLKAEDGNPPWVGMILSFLEDEDGDKAADFLCRALENSFRGKGLTCC